MVPDSLGFDSHTWWTFILHAALLDTSSISSTTHQQHVDMYSSLWYSLLIYPLDTGLSYSSFVSCICCVCTSCYTAIAFYVVPWTSDDVVIGQETNTLTPWSDFCCSSKKNPSTTDESVFSFASSLQKQFSLNFVCPTTDALTGYIWLPNF